MNEKTYAEAIAEKYAGKKVEILFDSNWGIRLYSDFQINNKPTVVGNILSANGNCLDISVQIEAKMTNITKVLSVNAWAILSISEYSDETSQVFAFTKQVLGKQ